MKARPARSVAIELAALVAIGTATAASAQDAATSMKSQIRRQQQVILQQQQEIRDSQRRLQTGDPPGFERSPATGELIDRSKLAKGPLSGLVPECPFGFSYSILLGCIFNAHPD